MRFSKTLNTILLAFLLLAFSACEETVELDLDFESRLVISSFFDCSSSWSVEVSESANTFDDESKIELVKNARVTIYDQDHNELYDLDHVGKGVYMNDETPSAGKGYHVKVEVGAKTLTAYSYVPAETTLTINSFSVVKEDNNEGVEVDFQIEDKSNLESYFIWEIVNIGSNGENATGSSGEKLSDALISNLNSLSSTSETDAIEIINVGQFGDGKYTTIYNTLKGRNGRSGLSENIITTKNNGQFFTAETLVSAGSDDYISAFDSNGGGNNNPLDIGGNNTPNPKFELRVVSISKELYDFYNSSMDAGEIPNTSINKQVPLFTNVENGIGVFAGFNESIIQF